MLSEKLKKAQSINLAKAAIDFLFDNKEILLAINKQQLLDSKDAHGKPLFSKIHRRGVYSKATEQISLGRKKAGQPYTLFDTGNFYKGFYIKRINDALEIDSNATSPDLFGTTLANILQADFGDIFGITDKNLQEIIDAKLKPYLIQYIKNAL